MIDILETCRIRAEEGNDDAVIHAIYFCSCARQEWPEWLASQIEQSLRTGKSQKVARLVRNKIGPDAASRIKVQQKKLEETFWHMAKGVQDARIELKIGYSEAGEEYHINIAAKLSGLPFDRARKYYKNTNKRFNSGEALFAPSHPIRRKITQLVIEKKLLNP